MITWQIMMFGEFDNACGALEIILFVVLHPDNYDICFLFLGNLDLC